MAAPSWSVSSATHRLLSLFVHIQPHEVPSVLYSFFTLFSILASYFLLLPLREDAGISLGTSNLPALYACSLVVTLIFTPAASAFVARSHPRGRERALQQFYCFMAVVLLGFYVVYSFSSFEAFNLDQALHRQEGAQQWMRQSSGLLNAQHTRHILSHPAAGSPVGTNLDAAAGVTEITAAAGAAGRTADETPQHGGEDRKHAPRDSNPAATQKYWLSRTWATAGGKSLENTVPPCLGGSGSSSCQRAHADGAAAAAVARRLQWLHRDVRTHPHSGTDSARNASIGNSNARSTGGYGSSSGSTRRRLSSRDGDAALSSWQRLLRGAFYVWVSLMNLVGISSLWARCADAFPPEAGARLFGFISAGATLGQLMGSLLAMLVAWAAELMAAQPSSTGSGSSSRSSSTVGTREPAVPMSGLILGSAMLQLLAAQLVCRVRPLHGSTVSTGSTVGPGSPVKCSVQHQTQQSPVCKRDGLQLKQRASDAEKGAGKAVEAAVKTLTGAHNSSSSSSQPSSASGGTCSSTQHRGALQLRSMLAGFQLIWRSSYLLMLCGNLLLTYAVGSLMYFQRALVVSTSVRGPSYRTAFFASVNTWSAACILVMQLFVTSSVLRHLGMRAALGLGPLVCLAGIVCISSLPSPAMVAVFEVVRRVFAYAVYKPSREVLFTVVSRDEKYSAKLVIDTVVQRMGDAIAAAAFQVLDVQFSLGQAGVGAAGCVMCFVWLATAHQLGHRHKQLALADAAVREKVVLQSSHQWR